MSQHVDFVSLRAGSLCVGGGGVSQHADFVSLRAGSWTSLAFGLAVCVLVVGCESACGLR